MRKFNQKLITLAYHDIHNKQNFEQQLLHLKRNYSILNLTDFKACVLKEKPWPKKPLLITSDDGDVSLYNNAMPVIKKLNVPLTVFLITALINTQKSFWWNEICYYLGEETGAKKAWEVKKWTNKKREAYLQELCQNSDKPRPEQTQLTTAQIKEMQEAGISFANHSHTHPMFDQCTKEELKNELIQAKSILNQHNLDTDVFAYPNGNYSERSEKMLKKHGIEIAFLFDHKLNKSPKKLNPLRISRLSVNDHTPLWKFKFILSGWHSKILPLTRAIGKLRS